MLLLISDTNVLVDIEDGNLTPLIFHLPYEIAVPDILFELELRERHSHLLKAGLKLLMPSFEFFSCLVPCQSMGHINLTVHGSLLRFLRDGRRLLAF